MVPISSSSCLERPSNTVHEVRKGLIGALVLSVLLLTAEGDGWRLHLQVGSGSALAVLLPNAPHGQPIIKSHTQLLGFAIQNGPSMLVHGILNAHDIASLELHLRDLFLRLHLRGWLEEGRLAQGDHMSTTDAQGLRVEGSGDDFLEFQLWVHLVLHPRSLQIFLARVRDLVGHPPIVRRLAGTGIFERFPVVLLWHFLSKHPVQGNLLLKQREASGIPLR
mmetsp:Transcript_68206/g.107157  ORF Transcript_68206/g.107157 Transcript_68206/m.107157 type:complete len:221 (-) Transcript_68206:1735-2397(-)